MANQAVGFSDEEEKDAWSRLTAEQFFAGYAKSDSIYDRIDEDENVDKIKPENS